MALNFINEVVKTTLLLAIVCAIAVALYEDVSAGVGTFIGAIWGVTNLMCLKYLLQYLLIIRPINGVMICLILGVKFPLLYLGGYALLRVPFFPMLSLLLGFSLIFLAIFLKGLQVANTQRV